MFIFSYRSRYVSAIFRNLSVSVNRQVHCRYYTPHTISYKVPIYVSKMVDLMTNVFKCTINSKRLGLFQSLQVVGKPVVFISDSKP